MSASTVREAGGRHAAVPWNLDRGPRSGEMGYLPGLDGLRALAVLGVLLYHADITWIRGGFLGVDVFFVLSGFLITSLILEEFERTGRVNFRQFYLRRARRLLPALFAVLLVTAALAAFLARDAAAQFVKDAVASVFYVTNWSYIVSDQSYFEAMARPPLLQHLWSLAVEEQFYLVWPLVALLLARLFGRTGVGFVAFILSLASTAWLVFMSIANNFPTVDPSRAYFGTDTHCMGLLLGAALATVWRPGRARRHLSWLAAALVTILGLASLGGVIYIFGTVGEYSPLLYHGGFFVLAALVCILVFAATHPGAPFGRMLGTQPWRYIGQRSYGLYLWHWPIFMLLRPGIDTPLDGYANVAVQLAITFAVAELSYRYIELPIRHGAIGRFFTRWRQSTRSRRALYTARFVTVFSAAAVVLAVIGVGLSTAPRTGEDNVAADVAEAMGIADGGPTAVLIGGPSTSSGAPSSQKPSGSQSTSSSPSPSESPSASSGPTEFPRNGNGVLTGIGDSVMLGARVTLQRVIDGTQIDAEVSRQAWTVLSRIRDLSKKGLLTPTVLIHTGTNGTISEDDLRRMLEILSDRDLVVVMNTSVPRSWEEPNNEVIAAVVPDYPNAVIADWWGISQGHREYFVSDGVHLTGDGMHAYAGLVEELMTERLLGSPASAAAPN